MWSQWIDLPPGSQTRSKCPELEGVVMEKTDFDR